MAKKRKIRGSVIAGGHQALVRGLTKESDIRVYSKGSSFYNESDFILLGLFHRFMDWAEQNPDQDKPTKKDWQYIQQEAESKVPKKCKIVLAATPDFVDKDYIDLLDGGLIHEVAHSLYTERMRGGYDMKRFRSIMEQHYHPKLELHKKVRLVQQLWNIFEDGYIERLVQKEMGGARLKLQRVHEFVWQLEKVSRNLPPGQVIEDPETGKQRKGFDPIDHFTCYLRDRVEEAYLTKAPYDEYLEEVKTIVDTVFADEIEDMEKAKDSYDTLALALRTIAKLDDLFDQAQQQSSSQGEGEEGEGEGDGQGEGQGTGKKGKGGLGDSKGQSSGQSDPDEEEEEGNGKGDGEGEDGEEKDGEGQGKGQGDPDDDEDGEGSGDGDKDGESDKIKSYEDVEGSILDKLKNADQAGQMKDQGDVLQQMWDDQVRGDVPKAPRPYTRDDDVTEYVKATNDGKETDDYNDMMTRCKHLTKAIRPKMAKVFQGAKKTRRKHRQKKGRRFGRNIAEVVYKRPDRLKPFQTKTTRQAKNAALSLVLDESGSMSGNMRQARNVLATLAMCASDLKIPHEVIGFTTSGNRDYNAQASESDVRLFTRYEGVRHRIFRTFDEPFNANSYRKLVHTRADALTPIPDAIEFAGERLLHRTEEKRILIVVTDGSPQYNTSPYSHQEQLQMMQEQVKSFAEQNVDTLFVGVGGSADFVRRYPNSVSITDMNHFAVDFNNFLFEQMKRLLLGG